MTDRAFETVVFLGPSCPADEALQLMPDGYFLPPVKCGDILQALRLNPRRIAIIDGVFREVPSVWHKEILFAMEKGVEVWGAASMGALRATELHSYGMLGFGKVFSDYCSNLLTDDDEVAIVYYQDGCRYVCATDAMVNVRATLQLAVEQSVVTAEYAGYVISKIKKAHFADRHLISFLKDSDGQMSNKLLQWLANGSYVDIKREDAIGLLSHLRDCSIRDHRPSVAVRRTLSLRRLSLRIMTAPLDFSVQWLPEHERRLQSWKNRSSFNHLRRLAYFLALYDGLLKAIKIETSDEPLTGVFTLDHFATSNSADADVALRKRMWELDCLFVNSEKYIGKSAGSWHSVYLCCLRLDNAYVTFKRDYDLNMALYAQQHPIEHRVIYLLSHLWWFYQEYLQQRGFRPQAARVHKQTIEFRRRHRLLSAAQTEKWLAANDLDSVGMHDLMTMECNYKYLVEGCFFENIGFFEIDEDRCWILDASRMVEGCIDGGGMCADL